MKLQILLKFWMSLSLLKFLISLSLLKFAMSLSMVPVWSKSKSPDQMVQSL